MQPVTFKIVPKCLDTSCLTASGNACVIQWFNGSAPNNQLWICVALPGISSGFLIQNVGTGQLISATSGVEDLSLVAYDPNNIPSSVIWTYNNTASYPYGAVQWQGDGQGDMNMNVLGGGAQCSVNSTVGIWTWDNSGNDNWYFAPYNPNASGADVK